MKVVLFHNADAGDGRASQEIAASLERQGHELVCVVENEADAPRLLEEPSDLVVAAGGDGTVALVARQLAGHDVPMAILPGGTANNIALTLGIDGSIDDVIHAWRENRRRRLDLGVAGGPWGQRLFVESVGVGLVQAGIAVADSRRSEDVERLASSLARTAQFYRDALAGLQPRQCTVIVDGRQFRGSYLLIEALNMPFVGPNLVFAPETDPADGLLTVVLAGEDRRKQLDEYLRHRMEGTDCPVSLPSYRGQRVDIDSPGDLHLDDQALSAEECVSLHISHASLEVLL